MQPTFTPLPEIQKMLTFSPIKTYRLFVQLRLQGKLRPELDWIWRDKTICIDMSRFFVELEAKGYKNFLQEEFREMNTNDFNRNQLLSNEIERNQVQESTNENKPPNQVEMKSDDNNQHQTISDDNKSNQMKSHDNELKSFVIASDISETLQTKNEMITILKEGIARAEREAQYLREANKDLSQQNQQLTKLTFMLMAPPVPDDTPKENPWRSATVEQERPEQAHVEREAEFIDADAFQQHDAADVQTNTKSS
jgi:hypothetical protein